MIDWKRLDPVGALLRRLHIQKPGNIKIPEKIEADVTIELLTEFRNQVKIQLDELIKLGYRPDLDEKKYFVRRDLKLVEEALQDMVDYRNGISPRDRYIASKKG